MHIEKKTLRNLFFVAAGCIILYWILHETERVKVVYVTIKGVLSPFVIGACIAFILNVPMRGFETLFKRAIKNRGIRRTVAILLTILCVLLVFAVVFMLLIPQIIDAVHSLIPKMYEFFLGMEKFVLDLIENNQALIDWGIENEILNKFDWANIAKQTMDIVANSIEMIVLGAVSAIGSIAGVLFDAVIAIVFALYCLFQKETLARQGRKLLYAYLPERYADEIVRIMRLTNSTFSNFLSGQCIEVCILGSLFAVTMAIFRMPYIALISVLVAVTAFVPVVGAWVGCIFGAFLILVSNPMQAIWFVVMFIVLQQLENNLIYPRVVGSSIGLSGMWVLLAVAIGGELLGVAGMFLMIPVASVIYTLVREYTGKRLENSSVDAEKLCVQPPELRSHFKEKRKKNKEKRAKKVEQSSKDTTQQGQK